MTETMVFKQDSGDIDFAAYRRAEEYLEMRGFSVGRMQADAPCGVLAGDFLIMKWRNLTPTHKAALHGTLKAPGRAYRTGPILVTIFDHSPLRLRDDATVPA